MTPPGAPSAAPATRAPATTPAPVPASPAVSASPVTAVAAPRSLSRRRIAGLATAVLGVLAAEAVHRVVPAVPMLTAAIALGLLAGHLPGTRALVHGVARPGLGFAAKSLMRCGIVLLGLKLSLSDVLGLGAPTIAMVIGVLLATLSGTWWLGRRLGLPGDQSLLIACGYAICGASAIGAVGGVRGSDEEDISAAVTLVTLCGTLAIVVLPLLQHPLGLNDEQFGRWIGAGVHDVGQVVAAAQSGGPNALREAVLVKLTRVMMLAPLVAAMTLTARRTRGARAAVDPATKAKRPPIVPLFVAGFLAAIALRSTGHLPAGVLTVADTAQQLVLAAALFGLGTAVRLGTMTRTGTRAAVLGLTSWIIIAGLSFAGVLLTT